MSSQDDFHAQIRDALNHLYDYHYLESHPLALRTWPGTTRRGPSRAERFNRLLLESIEELSPSDMPSTDTSRDRFYRLLVYRYVKEWPLPDIMRELGYGRTQFFREQRKAIAMLASVLRKKLPPEGPVPANRSNLLHTEAGRVLAQREAVDPAEVVRGILKVVGILAERHGVTLECDIGPELPPVYGSRTLMRQVFLEGLSYLVSLPGARHVCIRMVHAGQRLVAELATQLGEPGQGLGGATARPAPDLDPVRRLVEMVGGHWQGIEVKAGGCVCRFDFPLDSKIVLVIEDNEGIIRAFRGYLAGYGYQVVGATTGDDALRRAREMHPLAITLDIMMPTQDGWEILQALKDDPATQHVPVIICSVLEDPGLALSLGAVAYLQKPVTQADLLAVLDDLPGTLQG